MRIHVLYIVSLWMAVCSLTGCSKCEMMKYSEKPGINFMSYGSGGWSDGVTGLNISYNFGTQFTTWNAPEDTVILRVKLEGLAADRPLAIRLKAVKDAHYQLGEVAFFDNYAIGAGEYTADLPVILKRPAERDTVFRVKITVDYEDSDVVAGTRERQAFVLELQDQLTLELVKITMDDWEYGMEWVFGKYTNTKLRFIAYALQTADFRRMGWYGPSQQQIDQVQNKLKEYNEAHPGNPLLDDDGTPLVFEPIN